MKDINELRKELRNKLRACDVEAVRRTLKGHPEFLRPDCDLGCGTVLHHAAMYGHVPMIEMLVEELGMDVNTPAPVHGYGPVWSAVAENGTAVARWLLERGARINRTVKGESCCDALATAAQHGNLELVRLIVEHGGNVNACWGDPPMTPLSFALMYGRPEIVDYLRSKGALESWQLGKAPKPDYVCDSILEHVEKHLGKPSPLSLQEIVPADPSLVIYHIPPNPKLAELNGTCLALLTSGMSSKPMTVPQGGGDFRFAELIVYLPADWPLDKKALQDARHSWPVDWLRRIARWPHQNNTWLGGQSIVIANGDPPAPLGPGIRFTCWLLVVEPLDFGRMQRSDGSWINFYGMYPLYTEERNLEKQHGTEYILNLFQEHRFPSYVNTKRPNLAYAPKRTK